MRITTVTGTFEKRLSDGQYGSELASVQLTAELQPGDDVDEVGLLLAARARELALAQLGVSGSEYIRRRLDPSPALRMSDQLAAASADINRIWDEAAPAALPSAPPADDLEDLPF